MLYCPDCYYADFTINFALECPCCGIRVRLRDEIMTIWEGHNV